MQVVNRPKPQSHLQFGVAEAEESCLVAAEEVGAGLGGNAVQAGARTRQDQAQPARRRGLNFPVMQQARHNNHYSPAAIRA